MTGHQIHLHAVDDTTGDERRGRPERRSATPNAAPTTPIHTGVGPDDAEPATAAQVAVRPFAVGDLPALGNMLSRCSDDTIRARTLGGSRAFARRELEELPLRERQATRAAWLDGRMIGVASLLFDMGEAEIAVLVEDTWQRRGVGTALAGHLREVALLHRVRAVHATVGVTTVGALLLLHRNCPGVDLSPPADGLITATWPLPIPPEESR